MSDLEQRLADALTEGGQGAPSATGLASAARARARRRRRSRIAGGAALVALAVGVPGAVVALGGDDGRGKDVGPADHGNTAVDKNGDDGQDSVPSLAGGYHWESWHGITIQVPDSWVHGSLNDWCADGGDLTPRGSNDQGQCRSWCMCDPASTYGITFQEIDNRDDFQWPVVHQSGKGWPKENVSGGRGIGGVLVDRHDPHVHRGDLHPVLDACHRPDRRPERLPVPPEARRDQPSGGRIVRLPLRRARAARAERGAGRGGRR